jgi:hypothetical protein
MMRPDLRRRLTGALAIVVALATAAATASADPIAGARYSGAATDGARMTFRVSSDGTLVQSFSITGISKPCQATAGGATGVWSGAPITGDSFFYRLYDALLFRGTFPTPRTASGAFRIYTHAPHSSACDTHLVSWTAATTASRRPGAAGGHRPKFVATVTLRELSPAALAGRVQSPRRACVGGRTVILWLGSRRLTRTKTLANGHYSFAVPLQTGGLGVRVSVSSRATHAGICSAGSSTFLILT